MNNRQIGADGPLRVAVAGAGGWGGQPPVHARAGRWVPELDRAATASVGDGVRLSTLPADVSEESARDL